MSDSRFRRVLAAFGRRNIMAEGYQILWEAIGRHLKLVTVLMVVDFCILVGVLSILPSYFLANAKDSALNLKLKIQQDEPIPAFDQQNLKTIQDINSKMTLIENAEKNDFPISEKVINAILAQKTPDIKITQILYNNDPVDGKKISITGNASSREALLSFREALQGSPLFKSVDLPISNFVKGSNIQFYLSLTPQ